MGLGGRVRSERKARKLSQEALARGAGVSMNVIARLERGVITDPHVTTLSAVAAALGVPVGVLLGEEQSSVPLGSAPTSPEPLPETVSDEERRVADLGRWIEYIERRAGSWMQSAEAEDNPYLDSWRAALQWGSDVSEEALELFEVAEEAARTLIEDGEAVGAAAQELQSLEESYNRLWKSQRAVGRRVGQALDNFVSQLKDTRSLERVRKARTREDELEKKRSARYKKVLDQRVA